MWGDLFFVTWIIKHPSLEESPLFIVVPLVQEKCVLSIGSHDGGESMML